MGSLLAHAKGLSLMVSLSKEASILRVYVILNVENMSGALLLKGVLSWFPGSMGCHGGMPSYSLRRGG